MRRVAALVTAVVLTMSVPVAAAGFETPEEAIREYLEGVAQADIDRVLETSAADELAEGYRLDLTIDRFETFYPLGAIPGPVHDPFFADIERTSRMGSLLQRARMLAYVLLAPETLADVVDDFGKTVTGVDAAWAIDLMAELDPARLSGLEVVDIRVPYPDIYYSEAESDARTRRAGLFGADEMAERVALVAFEDNHYMVGFTLLRYGSGWKVEDQVSFLAGLTLRNGGVQSTTIEEWEELTSE